MNKDELLEQSIKELREIAFDLKTNQIVQDLESKHLKQNVDELKKLLEKEVERREKKELDNKSNSTSIKVSLITGITGFITAAIVAIIAAFKG